MAKTADYQLGSSTYPRGWMMVASGAAVTSTPAAARFFGEDVVLYRGQSGKAVMVEAYCPHMGAHLAVGASGATARHCVQVKGDAIRCPNHGWIFDADGRCIDIPYSPMKIPDTLRIHSWHLEERGGLIFAWYDAEGGEPTYELPELPYWQDPQWLCGEVIEMGEWDVHPMELAEHGVDKIHLANVHGADRVVYHKVTFDNHKAETESHTAMVDSQSGAEIVTKAISRYTGPGFLISEMSGAYQTIHLFCHTPVEDGRVRGWLAVLMRCHQPVPDDRDRQAYQQILDYSRDAFDQDLQIFQAKKPTLRAVQIPGDPPFRRYRQWYSQFYSPRLETSAIQSKANGVVYTEGVHHAPWLERQEQPCRENR